MKELLRLLSERCGEAHRRLDDIRLRALELVVAACVADSHELPPGELPPPGPVYDSPPAEPPMTHEAPLTDESTLAAAPAPPQDEDGSPWWEASSGGAPSPWAPAPAEDPLQPPIDDRPPSEPVRGDWEAHQS